MKKFLLPLILTILFFSVQSMAQQPARLTGVVTDSKNKALPSVTISIMKAKDSSFVKAEVSDASGAFEIPLPTAGDYFITYSLIGFETRSSEVINVSAGQVVTMKTMPLSSSSVKMQGVTVVSKKPMIEVKADKTIFNVESSINATGSDALELLQKSPGIQVDNNDNISMKGKSGVRIYVDGKMMQLDTKDLAAYLKSINSNDVEAIEMIGNPSAKYDASGNAGIINIRLKKNKKFGTNGSMNLGVVQGITPKGNGSLNLNYRNKKVNIFGNAGVNVGNYENSLFFNRIQKDTVYDQNTTMTSRNKSFNIKTGLDYFVNNKSTVGVMATTNFGENDWGSSGITNIFFNPTGAFVKQLKAFNTIPGNRTNANFNLNYRFVDTSGKEINFDADYGLFRGTGRSYQPNYYYDKDNVLLYSVTNRNYTPTDIDIYTAKLDVEQNLFKGKIGYGVKTSFVKTQNTFDFFNESGGQTTKVLDRSNRFEYIENVNAAYLNFNKKVNDKISFQTGLRLEQTNSEGTLIRADSILQGDNIVKRNYLDFFPSAAISWTVNNKNSLNLTFSRRIDRPTYQDLNPFENKIDELTYQKGNAFLRPQYTNSLELTHTFISMINTTVGYSFVKDFATEVTDTVQNATFLQQQNLAQQQILNFSIGSALPINKWWNGYANFWYNYQMFDGKIGNNTVNASVPSYGGYLQQAFTLGNNYSAEISGWFNGPSVWGGTWRTRPQGGVDVGIQKQLLKKKATLKLSVTDIFHTAPWQATNNFGGISIKGGGQWESQTVRLNFSWRFGNNLVKNSRERKTGLESESKRIKGGN